MPIPEPKGRQLSKKFLANRPKWTQISMEQDIEIQTSIGSGAAATVYKAYWKSQEKEVAVKKIRCPNPEKQAILERELEILSQLKHKNVIEFYGAAISIDEKFHETHIYHVMEIAKMTLFDYRVVLGKVTKLAKKTPEITFCEILKLPFGPNQPLTQPST